MARNLGARHATAEILVFLDSDILVRSDTVSREASGFESHHDITELFGSYDAETATLDSVSQYKNLLHQFVH